MMNRVKIEQALTTAKLISETSDKLSRLTAQMQDLHEQMTVEERHTFSKWLWEREVL